MKPSQRVMQLKQVYFCSAMPDGYTGHTQLEATTINHLYAPVTAVAYLGEGPLSHGLL